MHDYYNYIILSMKHGIITIYIIDFLNRGIQDRHREYTRDFCRNTHLGINQIYFHNYNNHKSSSKCFLYNYS